MMRNLLVLGLVIGGAFMAGWFTISRQGDRTTIEIDRGEIRSDASQVIDRGREYLDRREQNVSQETQWADQPQQPAGNWSPQQPQQPYQDGRYPEVRFAEQYPVQSQGTIQTQGYWTPQAVPQDQYQQTQPYAPSQQPYSRQ